MPKELTQNRFKDKWNILVQGEYLIIRFAMVALLIAGLANILSAEVSSLFPNRSLFPELVKVVAVSGGGIIALISGFVALLQQRTKQGSALRFSVQKAYAKALDETNFNPQRQTQLTDAHTD